MNPYALQVKNLSASVGNFKLQEINFSLKKGRIMGLIGKNGAGKTTLIKSILHQNPATEGEVLFNGLPLPGNEELVKRKLGIVYDQLIYPAGMKPKKLVKIFAPFYDREAYIVRFHALMQRFQLDPNKKLVHYSKGMQMKFSVVMALAHNPDLVIMDEPTAGLDPVARVELLDCLLEHMQDEEKSLIFSTHITSDLEKVADDLTFIDEGKIIFNEEKDALLDRFSLVSIDKSEMTDSIKRALWGMKESSFGFTGLLENKDMLRDINGVKTQRPTIEDLMIYSGRKGGERNV